MNALELIGVTKNYKTKNGQYIQALAGLDLTIAKGEIFGFLGPNGAGKSTTIKTVMGQIIPTNGMIKLFGVPATDHSARKKIGYLPENPSFYDFLSAREYLEFVGSVFGMGKAAIATEVERTLNVLELSEAIDRPIRSYSKGMVQRLGIAQVLLHDPDLYILDEPMSGLDPVGRALVKNIIKDLKMRGKSVFFSTHITSDIEVVCDRVGIIAKGRLLAVDKVDTILQKGSLGYDIQIKHPDGACEELYVETRDLKLMIEKMVSLNVTVERIEPKRKDMEAFFLDIITRD